MEPIAKILIVDDDETQMRALCEILSDHGYTTAGYLDAKLALTAMQAQTFDIVLTDLSMPVMDGVEFLSAALQIDPHLVGILLTGQGSIETAVAAMKAGAMDYVLKPVKLNALLPVLFRAADVRRLRLENMELRNTVAMHELNQVISNTLDPVTLLDKIVRAALTQFEADEASVMLVDSSTGQLYVAASVGHESQDMLGLRVPMGRGIAGWVALHQEPLVFEGPITDPRFNVGRSRPEIQSSLSVPMITRNHLVGVLNLNCIKKRHVFTQGQIRISTIFTNSAATGVLAARMYDEQHKLDLRYREILRMAADAIISIDEDQKIVVFNHGAEKLFGFKAEEIIGQSINLILPDEIAVAHVEHLRTFVGSQERSRDMVGDNLRGKRKDGSLFGIEASISRHSEGGQQILTAVVRDITEKQQEEMALRAAQVAESANQAKSEFLATMSHELRTPLNTIIGYAEILVEEVDATRDLNLVDIASKIQFAGQHLQSLIDDILDLSKIEAGKMEISSEPTDMDTFTAEISSMVVPLARKNANRFLLEATSGLRRVDTDPLRLRQLLFNLLSNAFKFTENGEVRLKVWQDPDNTFFQVKDTGIGMTAAQLSRIFEPFEQADAKTSRAYGGTGLGLAISWRIAQLLGGEINVHSALNRGSEFTLRIP